MRQLVRTVVVFFVGLAPVVGTTADVVAPGSPADAPSSPVENTSDTAVVVLQDGGVLSGRMTREGDFYVVRRGGANLRIAAADVIVVASSLEDAYDQRRQRLPRPTAEAHLSLAEWCLRYDLLAQAGEQLAEAGRLEPSNPRLALLQRRVELETKRREKPATAQTLARPQRESVTPSQRNGDAEIKLGSLPSGVVERFTRRVQPVLVNNCTASGCHQPGGAQQFQLDRGLLHGLANRRSTMKNLAATLALVDHERPLESPLLTVPRQTHGGMQGPIFGPRQEQAFRHLVEWTTLVSGGCKSQNAADMATEDTPQVAVVELTGTVGMIAPITSVPQPTPPTSADHEPAQAPAIDPAATTASDLEQALYEEDVAELAEPAAFVRFGVQLEKWQPKDPFDPEIFHRQQVAQRKLGGAGGTARANQ